MAALEGALALAFVMGLYWVAAATGKPEAQVRLLAFSAVVAANLTLIFFTRSGGDRLWRHIVAGNPTLWIVACATVIAYALLLSVRALREQFRLAAPTLADAYWLATGLILLWSALVLANAVNRAWVVRARPTRAAMAP